MASPKKKEDSGMASPKKKEDSALEFCIHFPPFLVHVALVLFVGWISSFLKFNLPFVFTLGLAYLYFVEQRINAKTKSRIRSEERRANDRKRLLSDAETARWLNSTVETIWPIFMENFVSQKLLMAVAPWFLEKYKPFPAKKVVLQQICLGRSPPVMSMLRCGNNPTNGDHLVLEMDMKFFAARDMSAVVAVQMRKRVGLGLWTSLNISNLQLEGKVRVGIRFTRGWPVVERLRVCFSEAPVLRMTAKPIINYGLDVTDLPGIAGWIDKMIVDALENSLVEPNFLEVDVEKLVGSLAAVYGELPPLASNTSGPWFCVSKAPAVSVLKVEVLEGKKLVPSDMNGKADPYVKLRFGAQKPESTTIKHKTLQPTWHETFYFPVESWDLPSKLELRVRDKDRFGTDDDMGCKEIECKEFNDGERHDMWVTLDEVKTGQLHIAITVEKVPETENNAQEKENGDTPDSGRPTKEVPRSSVEKVPESPADRHENGNYQESDSESGEVVLADCQAVEVGYGQSGAVSIVTPGKAQVKEATNVERLRQRKKHALDKVQGIDCADPSVVSGGGRRAKLKKLLIHKKSSDSSGELLVTGEGEKGTTVQLAVETAPGCRTSDLLPSSGELPIGSDECQDPEECVAEKPRLKRMRTFMQKLGKGAHNVGSAISKMNRLKTRSRSGKNLSLSADEEEICVPETRSSTDEGTENKVLEAADASCIQEQRTATKDVGTDRKEPECAAETGNSDIYRDSPSSTTSPADERFPTSSTEFTDFQTVTTANDSPITSVRTEVHSASGPRQALFKRSTAAESRSPREVDHDSTDELLSPRQVGENFNLERADEVCTRASNVADTLHTQTEEASGEGPASPLYAEEKESTVREFPSEVKSDQPPGSECVDGSSVQLNSGFLRDEGEANAVRKLRRVEAMKSPTTEKPSQNSNGLLAPIKEGEQARKESSRDVFGKLAVDCRTTLSTGERLIPLKFARSSGGLDRNRQVSEVALTTPPSSVSLSVSDLSQGASGSRGQQDLRKLIASGFPKCQESASMADGAPEGEESGCKSESPRAREIQSAPEPGLVPEDHQSNPSRASLHPKVSVEVMSWRPLVNIVTDDTESTRGSQVNTPVASPRVKDESPRTPGGIGSASSKFLSRVTAFKTRGLSRSLSCRNPPTAFFGSETKELGEILRGKAEAIRSQRNSILSSAVLAPLTEGPSPKADIHKREEARAAAVGGEISHMKVSLSRVSALETVTGRGRESSASETADVRDDISSKKKQAVDTSAFDSSLDTEKGKAANAEDRTSSVVVALSGISSDEEGKLFSTSGDSSSSKAHGLRESRSTPQLSSDILPLNVRSPAFPSEEEERETEMRNGDESSEKISSKGQDVPYLPGNDNLEFTQYGDAAGLLSPQSSLSRTKAFRESVSNPSSPITGTG
ncbi:hypothetical protein R1sor_019161 [Riccia sorocarpa]|uniref:C2 domain-containing protein n=1 Tax=Riccia sorocarpa TaxID=122646 RepID=A0ABD3IDG6_9MARC